MQSAKTHRRALTLVELLVVVTILVILVAVVLPLAQPALRGREVREGARQLHAFVSRVQTEAIANNRSHGIELVRSEQDPMKCFELRQVRYRNLFAGLSPDSRVRRNGKALDFILGIPGSPQDEDTKALLGRLLKRNEVIYARFDYRGNWIPITRKDIPTTNYAGLQIEFVDTADIPGSFANMATVAYQIKLPPRATSAASVELPQGAFIDLAESGSGIGTLPRNQFQSNKRPIMIMFDTSGKLSELRQAGAPRQGPDTMFLLVRNETPEAPSYWVTIGSSTNRVTTTENLGTRESALSGISASGR